MNWSDDEDHPEDKKAVGYRKPPVSARFKPGQSGNPRGRPPGHHRELPYEAVLGRKVKVREAGGERWVSAAEAFLMQLAKRGLEGDSRAARDVSAALEGSEGQASA